MDFKIQQLFSRYETFPPPAIGIHHNEMCGYISLFHIKCSIISMFGKEMKLNGRS